MKAKTDGQRGLADPIGDGRHGARQPDRVRQIPVEDLDAGRLDDVHLADGSVLSEHEADEPLPGLSPARSLLGIGPVGLDPPLQLREVVGVPRVGRVQRHAGLAVPLVSGAPGPRLPPGASLHSRTAVGARRRAPSRGEARGARTADRTKRRLRRLRGAREEPAAWPGCGRRRASRGADGDGSTGAAGGAGDATGGAAGAAGTGWRRPAAPVPGGHHRWRRRRGGASARRSHGRRRRPAWAEAAPAAWPRSAAGRAGRRPRRWWGRPCGAARGRRLGPNERRPRLGGGQLHDQGGRRWRRRVRGLPREPGENAHPHDHVEGHRRPEQATEGRAAKTPPGTGIERRALMRLPIIMPLADGPRPNVRLTGSFPRPCPRPDSLRAGLRH